MKFPKRIPSPAELALAASAVAITGIVGFVVSRKAGIISGTYANPMPVPSSDAAAKRIPAVAERLKRLWPDVTGEKEMPPEALEIALAQAWLESGVAEAGGGGWWTDKTDKGQGDMRGSGNLGARQCGANDDGGSYYDCVPYGDTVPQSDGSSKAIDANFMFFKAGKTPDGKDRDAGDAAAWRFLTDITKTWPAKDELKSGDVMAYAKRQGPKQQGGNGYYQGFGATTEERVAGYARAIASHVPAVAAALGHKKVYAKIIPELLASGPTHAPVTAGVQLSGADLALALHSAGVLPRARAIPGSRGHVVWYIERPEVGAAPRDVMLSEREAAEQDAIMRGVGAPVEGAGAVIVGILAGILVAGGIAAALAKRQASEILGKVRAAGYDIIMPGSQPKSGWTEIVPTDAAFNEIRAAVGDGLFSKLLAAGVKFQRAPVVAGYGKSSRWTRRAPPVGDLADDILSAGTQVLQTVNNATSAAKQDAAAAQPAQPPAAAPPAPAATESPVSSTAITIAVASGAAVVVLLAVAAAWRIAKPRLGEARGYPLFAWMSSLPDHAVATLRSGVPLTGEQIRTLTVDQCRTIVDHALVAAVDGKPDPGTWFLTGDDRVPLAGTADAVQAASTAVVGVVALVGAILLYREISKQGDQLSERAGQAFQALEESGPTAAFNAWMNPACNDPNDPDCIKRSPSGGQEIVDDHGNVVGHRPPGGYNAKVQGVAPRWVRWIAPDVGDALQADASSAKKIVDGIAEKYGSDQAAKVVGSTTGGALTGLSIGTALGTAFPGLGNVVGAAVGALVGALAGLISGLVGLGPSPEQVALAAEINKFNTRVHAALASIPPDARQKIGMILVESMRQNVGSIPLCVGPNAQGDASIACVMTNIDGIRDAALHLDENVQKWLLEYQAEVQAAKARTFRRVAAATGGITLAALAALGVAVKTGAVRLGDAQPMFPEFAWMNGFPVDVIAALRAGPPDAAVLRRLNRAQMRMLASHASVGLNDDGTINPASWSIS